MCVCLVGSSLECVSEFKTCHFTYVVTGVMVLGIMNMGLKNGGVLVKARPELHFITSLHFAKKR